MSYKMFFQWNLVVALLAQVVFVSGCKEKPKINPKGTVTQTKETPKTIPLSGTWTLTYVEHSPGEKQHEIKSMSIPVCLLKFEPLTKSEEVKEKKTDYKVTLVESTKFIGKRTLSKATVKDNKIHVVLESDHHTGPIEFQGVYKEGAIRGSVLFPKLTGQCHLSRLIPAGKATKFSSQIQPSQLFLNEINSLNKNMQHTKNEPQLIYETLLKTVTQNPELGYSIFLYEFRVLDWAVALKSSDKQIGVLFEGYQNASKNWGEQYEKYARINFATLCVQNRYLPEIALNHLKIAKQELTEEQKKYWIPRIDAIQTNAIALKKQITFAKRVADLMEKLNSKEKKTHESAAEGLEEVLKENPNLLPARQLLADYYEQKKDYDTAIEMNAKLAVTPAANVKLAELWRRRKQEHALPQEILVRLWKQKYGNTEKLNDFLTEKYNKLLATLPAKKITRSDEETGNHVVLCELFTGSKCPPCVAADLALGLVEKNFSPSDVIVLRYHQHIPLPDPFANKDSRARFGYYHNRGTPTLQIDGETIPAGGFMQDVEPLYGSLSKVIQEKLKEKTKAKITLTATGKGETLHLTAKVTGLSKPAETLRLRLVLAEEKIPYVAKNGIRFHDMIVRKLPGGVAGIKFKEETIEYDADINLSDFKTDLLEQLEVVEESSKNEVFPIKPMSLQKLHLIGMVQDDKDGKVLQSKIIPVSGTLNYPDQKTAPVAPPVVPAIPVKPEKIPLPKKTTPKTVPPEKPKTATISKPPAKKAASEKQVPEKKKSAAFFSPAKLEPVLFLQTETKEEKPTKNQEKENQEEKKEVIQRHTIAGNWILDYYPSQGEGRPIALLKIEKKGEGYNVKSIDKVRRVGEIELSKSHATKSSISFEVDGRMGPFRFEGTLARNVIAGTMLSKEGRAIPAKLRPFAKEKLGDAAVLQRDPNVIKLFTKVRVTEDEEIYQVFRKFVKDHPHSAITTVIYSNVLINNAKLEGLSVELTATLAKEYMKDAAYWGPQMQQHARLSIADALITRKFAPQLAKQYLDEATKHSKQGGYCDWSQLIQPSLEQLKQVTAFINIGSGDKEIQKKAFDFLTRLQEKDPFNHQVIWTLARHAENNDNSKEAMKLYAQLSSLPLMESLLRREWAQEDFEVQPALPSDELERLWKKKFGPKQGAFLEKYKTNVYKNAIAKLPGKKFEPRKANSKNHVVLCELFTGAACPPCVGADLATGALQETFATTELIMLRYHEHIPAPDPFANKQTQERFQYYSARGTPALFLDGTAFRGGGGYLQQAKPLYKRLSESVKKKLTTPSKVTIQLSANVVDGDLQVTASADNLPNQTDNLRLRLVIAEDHLEYVARNGIRLHEMVVRQMPGGVEGTKAKKGKLQFEENLSLAKFKKEIIEQTTNFENRTGVLVPKEALQLEKLSVVAFIQDDKSGEILQSAFVSIKDKISYLKEKKKEEKEEK